MSHEEQKLPYHSTLTGYGFYLTGAIEAGHKDALSVAQVYAALEANRFPEAREVIGYSLADFGEAQDKALLWILRVIADGMKGDERRKYAVSKSGLCLLNAFVLEAIQQGFWDRKTFDETRGYGVSPFAIVAT